MSSEDFEDDLCPCPFCSQPIYFEAERCHHCGDYISADDWRSNSRTGKYNRLVVIAVVLAILGMLLPFVGSLFGL